MFTISIKENTYVPYISKYPSDIYSVKWMKLMFKMSEVINVYPLQPNYKFVFLNNFNLPVQATQTAILKFYNEKERSKSIIIK